MSIATAAAALRDADEALAPAQVIRAEAFEALVAACEEAGWRVIFRHRDTTGAERVVLQHDFHGRSMDLVQALGGFEGRRSKAAA